MIKKHLKKYLLSFSIISTLGISTWAWACGWYDNSAPSNFAPEIFVDESLTPLFYESSTFFYQTTTDDHNSRFRNEISDTWESYLDGVLDSHTINDLLFDEDQYSLKRITNIAFENASDEQSSNLPMENNKFNAFIKYLYVARSIDQHSTSSEYSWNAKQPEAINLRKMNQIAFQLYNSAQEGAFKAKVWLLIHKMYFYHFNEMTDEEINSCTNLYHETINKVPKDIDYYRVLGYMAGVYYKQKHFTESNCLYTNIFINCPELSKTAAFSYHPLEVDEVRSSLPSCKNSAEKCALWALQGFYTDERLAMEEIAKIDVNSKFLPLMLSRAINKAEIEINSLNTDTTLQVNIERQYNNVDDKEQSLYNQIKQIAQSPELKDKFVWYTALGYIEMLHHLNNNADKSFEIARQSAPNKLEALNQIRVLQLMNNLNKIDKITPDCFNGIDEEIQWLLVHLKNYNTSEAELGAMHQRIENAKVWVSNYLTLLYKDAENYTMASMYDNFDSWYYGWSKSEWVDDENTTTAILALLEQKNHTLMETTAIEVGKLSQQDIYTYRNIKAIFDDRLNDISNLANRDFPANPFNGSIQDNHDAEHSKGRTYSYSKMIETMKIMENNIANGDDIYNNALLMGNAFYSITHYGNCRLTSKLTGSFDCPESYRPAMQKMMTNCDNAVKYYQMAYDAASNNEQRAKCAYMLAKCERNSFYNGETDLPMYYKSQYGYNRMYMLHEWNGFKLLKDKYSDTDYFKEVINECGYFELYDYDPTLYQTRKTRVD